MHELLDPKNEALPLKVWVRESLSRADLAILAFGAAILNKLSLRLKPSHCLVRDRDPVRQTLPSPVKLCPGLCSKAMGAPKITITHKAMARVKAKRMAHVGGEAQFHSAAGDQI